MNARASLDAVAERDLKRLRENNIGKRGFPSLTRAKQYPSTHMLARLSVCLAFRCRRRVQARVQQFIHYCLANTLDARSIILRFAFARKDPGVRRGLEFRFLLSAAGMGKVLRRLGIDACIL